MKRTAMTTATTANNSGTMGAGTITKHGHKSKSRMSRHNSVLILLLTVLIMSASSCSSPASDGTKSAKIECDCHANNDYYEKVNKIYEEYIANFATYSFSTRTEARTKLSQLQEAVKTDEENFNLCLQKANQYRDTLESKYLNDETKKLKFQNAYAEKQKESLSLQQKVAYDDNLQKIEQLIGKITPIYLLSERIIGGERLLGEGEHRTLYEYDDRNRITKTIIYNSYNKDGGETIFQYNGDGDLISFGVAEITYKKNGDITVVYPGAGYCEIELDKDGLPIKVIHDNGKSKWLSKFESGNIIEHISYHEGGKDIRTFKYDDKKSPFYNCTTPKWALLHFLNVDIKNNENSQLGDVTYTYNEEGYPLTKTLTMIIGHKGEDGVMHEKNITETETYKYIEK